ncbi:MAG: diaminopimelate epimerase [Oscillospiraceae bacterium]|nr:diaminopimelate epimerase [Oscillospiraceae bacterium]
MPELRFTKMHGCGNDYVYISTFDQTINDHAELTKKLSDRRFGIGGDGVIFVCPSDIADAKMRIFNMDGSEAQMCGNGIRCVAKFLYDEGIARKEVLRIDTLSGVKEVHLHLDGGEVTGVTVDMGKAVLDPAKLPVLLDGSAVIDRPVEIGGKAYRITCVSMGNPHCVLFVEDPASLPLETIGPVFEHAPLFPERINTEFVRVIDRTHLEMRVWERGSGETLACGTGACATVVAAVENGFCPKGEPVTVSLRGGDLQITYTDECVLMQGPATTVFHGTCLVK